MAETRLVTNSPGVGSVLLDRLKTLGSVWRDLAASIGGTPKIAPELPPSDADQLRKQIEDCLVLRGGEVSARARAAALGRTYLSLNEQGRRRFLALLAHEYGADRDSVDAGMAAVAQAVAPGERFAAEQALREALESPRIRLLSQFNTLPEGVKFLVDMRAEVMALAGIDPAMGGLNADLKELLSGWFDIGFLELERITWRSPALLLEKIMSYEAVHAIQGWQDLKNRLDSDRRLYAFFHPRMPDEPLIFVEVALVKGIAGSIHELLDEKAPLGDPEKADTAIFYSINNAQKGLVGISFGNFLIKRVVDRLSHDFPNLKTFATLSPIPGFGAWLDRRLEADEPDLLTASEKTALAALPNGEGGFKAVLAGDWSQDPASQQALKGPLMRLGARYLTQTKRERAIDPVANFHLSNGARMERLNWMADLSRKGVEQSAGMMINYLYKLSDIEANHEAYRGQGRIALSSGVKSLLKE